MIKKAFLLSQLTALVLFCARPALAQEATSSGSTVYLCSADDIDLTAKAYGDSWYAYFESTLSLDEIKRRWSDFVNSKRSDLQLMDCGRWPSLQSIKEQMRSLQTKWPRMNYISVDFDPSSIELSSHRKTKSVLFRPAHGNERGYEAVTFDVEYQFIVCSGELHIAYSIVEDSVRKAHNDPFSDLYLLGGQRYEVSTPPKTILNLPLKGRVFPVFNHAQVIGTFADDNAGKALGFGCFSGQSQKIADVKDLRDENGGQPSKEYLPKVLDLLDVSFETTQVLTSADAEDEIRAGLSKDAAAKDEQAVKSAEEHLQADQGPSEADLRAQRRAQEEAEFQAKERAYEEGMAEHEAAVEQYQKALADVEAQKVANAAAAKAQQDEFARKQAEYETEAAKAKQAQDEYEAKYGKPQ